MSMSGPHQNSCWGPSAPTALKCPDQPDLGPAPTQPLPKGPETWFQVRLSHAAGSPTPSPALAVPNLLSGWNLDPATSLCICPAITGLPVKPVTVTNLAPLRCCGTVPCPVTALSCLCCGHHHLLAHLPSQDNP